MCKVSKIKTYMASAKIGARIDLIYFPARNAWFTSLLEQRSIWSVRACDIFFIIICYYLIGYIAKC